MLALGARLASQAGDSGMLIFLSGELGAGKTTLVRGFLQALGHAGAVRSPTYALVESYAIDGKEIFHFDLYRLTGPEELEAAGLREYFHPSAICLVEWPERGIGALPEPDLHLELTHAETGREVAVRSAGPHGNGLIETTFHKKP